MNRQGQQETEREFVDLVKRYERVIYKVCSFYATEVSPMEDLYQEAVLNLWKAFPKFRGESQISTWIYRVTLNSCISDLRRNGKHVVRAPLEFAENIVFQPDTMETELRELYRLIRQLGKLERAIILLWLEDRPYQEIADITGLTVSNVGTRLKRTKEKLKSMSNQ
ncbi:MAG: sigma-70 family RNA polymerase sigma factor [Dysgonamonadaceae bacterium]|jgi:RNA polymerase sigma-70 factor (ECF subfamily)|nr:sigma-70 family RNA polymerase sigma factor [Dysgonamonadaceae bacterium]